MFDLNTEVKLVPAERRRAAGQHLRWQFVIARNRRINLQNSDLSPAK